VDTEGTVGACVGAGDGAGAGVGIDDIDGVAGIVGVGPVVVGCIVGFVSDGLVVVITGLFVQA